VGTGSGTSGSGTGGGGGGRRAQQVRGELRNSDYPRTALRMGIEGTVTVRYTVLPDGRVTDCAILETSGSAELDGTTCRLIERRFEYRPALDGAGRPIPQELVKTYDWWLPSKRAGYQPR
jgi:protein TonB